MPYISCNLHSGLPLETRRELALELAKAVHESLGSPMQYIHVSVVEVPGDAFVESGVVNFSYSEASETNRGQA